MQQPQQHMHHKPRDHTEKQDVRKRGIASGNNFCHRMTTRVAPFYDWNTKHLPVEGRIGRVTLGAKARASMLQVVCGASRYKCCDQHNSNRGCVQARGATVVHRRRPNRAVFKSQSSGEFTCPQEWCSNRNSRSHTQPILVSCCWAGVRLAAVVVMMRSREPINQNISQLQQQHQLQFSSGVQFGFSYPETGVDGGVASTPGMYGHVKYTRC